MERITILDNEGLLREVSLEVDFENDDYKRYIDELRDYCVNNMVYALAPVQIGIPKRIIYIRNTTQDMNKNFDNSYNEEIIYINPVITASYGHTKFLEGCASCITSDNKHLVGVIDRPYKIEINYQDINGMSHNKTIEGFEATVFSHEYDHLNGILHMDRTGEIFEMTPEQMKKYRLENPYQIITKDDEFLYDNIDKSK